MHLFPGLSIDLDAAVTEGVQLPVCDKQEISLSVLRLDKIHPVVSGNKWFKLLYHLEAARQQRAEGLLSFGGAYSNHIVAVACAAADAGLASVGVIRGEAPAQLSPTLQDAQGYGMQLVFMERSAYKTATDPEGGMMVQAIAAQYPGYFLIPEGGSGPRGVRGSAEILPLINAAAYSHLLCAMGTGTMFAGLAEGVGRQESGVGRQESGVGRQESGVGSLEAGVGRQEAGVGSQGLGGEIERQVIGIPVLKGEAAWAVPPAGRIIEGYHFGGYARRTPALLEFMNFFYDNTGIPTDFVYTGKLLFATLDLIGKGYFARGSRVVAVHSGGLQGNRSLKEGTLHF